MGSVWSDGNAVALIAVLEPLDAALRARFGQMVMPVALIAALEPLEVPLRARFGQSGSTRALIAVLEPLEASLRARLHLQERHPV